MLGMISMIFLLVPLGEAVVTSCQPGAPAWHVWRVFDAQVAVVEGPLKRAKVTYQTGFDSSIFVWAVWLAQQKKEMRSVMCPSSFHPSRCVFYFSPFADSCVSVEGYGAYSVEWSPGSGSRRRIAYALGAFFLNESADWLAEATTLHFAIGVSTGVLAMAVLVVAFALHLCGGTNRQYASRLRLATLVAVAFGYATFLWQTALGSLAYLVNTWPVALAVYLCLSFAASAVGTTLVLSQSRLVPHFVNVAARLAALFLAFNSTHSVTAGTAYAVGLALYSSASFASLPRHVDVVLHSSPLSSPPQRKSAGKTTQLLSTLRKRLSGGLDDGDEAAPAPRRNYLYGHRYLTEDQYRLQAERSTEAALYDLSHSPGFSSWVQRNHSRVRSEPVDEDY